MFYGLHEKIDQTGDKGDIIENNAEVNADVSNLFSTLLLCFYNCKYLISI